MATISLGHVPIGWAIGRVNLNSDYPPDETAAVTTLVLGQAALFADELVTTSGWTKLRKTRQCDGEDGMATVNKSETVMR